MLAALAKATGDDAVAALAVSPREPMRMSQVAPALADALAGAKQPVVLVLDDFHEVVDAVQRTSNGSCASRRRPCGSSSSRGRTRRSGSVVCVSTAA